MVDLGEGVEVDRVLTSCASWSTSLVLAPRRLLRVSWSILNGAGGVGTRGGVGWTGDGTRGGVGWTGGDGIRGGGGWAGGVGGMKVNGTEGGAGRLEVDGVIGVPGLGVVGWDAPLRRGEVASSSR